MLSNKVGTKYPSLWDEAGRNCLFFVLFFLFGVGQLQAHHSRAGFDQNTEIRLEGEILDYRWTNPHIYFKLFTDEGAEWLVEGHSTAGVRTFGWTRETLREGDRVLIGARPNVNPDKPFVLISWVQDRHSDLLLAYPGGKLPADLLAQTPENVRLANATSRSERESTEASDDFSGNWLMDLSGVNLSTGSWFDPNPTLPMTEAGRQWQRIRTVIIQHISAITLVASRPLLLRLTSCK